MTKPPRGTILYVDDDEINRNTFALVFREAGFDVKEAATGGEALRLAEEKPDVVILDVSLPDINGVEVCRHIKMHPATRTIPVMHMSAVYVTTEDRTHALDEGADVYLTKPVEPRELVAQVKALMRTHLAEERATAAAQRWQATFAAINDGVCLPAKEILGRLCDELIPAPPGDSVFRRMLETRRREMADLAIGNRWLQTIADPMRMEDGTTSGAVYILSDITERKRLEEQLRQSQKMEALGQLAGGVAHDFNNLLTAITGNVSLLLAGTPEQDPDRESLLAIDQAAWRAAELTRQLLGFSRQSAPRLKPTDLRACLDEVAALLRRAIDPRITQEARTSSDLWVVQANPGQINQVLMNLCLNARDAMPGGGRLLMEAENISLDEGQARQSGQGRPGDFVLLRVQDNGHGISPEVLPHIFEPFFTTRQPGSGTGLGLATVFSIVRQHQGWIDCSSAVNQGTCFTVYLPRCESAAGSTSAAAPLEAPGGTETILLADDDVLVRNVGREVLKRHGYEVLTAENGEEAANLYRQHQHRIGLVILDLNMPGLSWRDTLERLLQVDPRVRVLLSSGYSEDLIEPGTEGVLGFLEKPYREQDLAVSEEATPTEVESDSPPECRSGLTKAKAEELLDWLEARGWQRRELRHEGAKGFSVRWRETLSPPPRGERTPQRREGPGEGTPELRARSERSMNHPRRCRRSVREPCPSCDSTRPPYVVREMVRRSWVLVVIGLLVWPLLVLGLLLRQDVWRCWDCRCVLGRGRRLTLGW